MTLRSDRRWTAVYNRMHPSYLRRLPMSVVFGYSRNVLDDDNLGRRCRRELMTQLVKSSEGASLGILKQSVFGDLNQLCSVLLHKLQQNWAKGDFTRSFDNRADE
ncbi:hypothetical protein AVEN_124739-1 [Araneus ventricosus]|uniref:Uncharacterized protein n=1 Tax=Araneus ventricosus TaxID=182803 RepID=A0A4Y2W4S4_ARAVE|nr:hypothetical protein AVEN_124739-1 [Araneus ventricosus]